VASPETLFKIGFDDGTAYARAGRQEADATGTTPEVFEFDVDGTLVAEARLTVDNAPDHRPQVVQFQLLDPAVSGSWGHS
jgi:hypothetical protein